MLGVILNLVIQHASPSIVKSHSTRGLIFAQFFEAHQKARLVDH